MIHIATIHHNSDKFIDIQNDYLKKHTTEPYQVYAGLFNCISNNTTHHYVDNLKYVRQDHHIRMNHLANVILKTADDNDLLVFIDGDAFPIMDWIDKVKPLLQDNKIVAVQRNEINDTFPHPIFLCTTVGFWRSNKLSWEFHYKSATKNINVQTSGPALEAWLDDHNIKWHPVNKTNKIITHPIFFAVYDFIYHHGAGFREMLTTVDYDRNGWVYPTRFPDSYSVAKINKEYSDFFYDKIKNDMEFIRYYFIGKQFD